MAAEPIAVVGSSAILPGAPTPQALWAAVLAARVSIGATPPGRWPVPAAEALADTDNADVTSGPSPPVGGYVTDPVTGSVSHLPFGDGHVALDGLDPVFAWTVHGASAAVAGLPHRPDRTGLVVGNLSYPTSGLAARARDSWLARVAAPVRAAWGIDPSRPAGGHPLDRFSSGLPTRCAAAALGFGGPAHALDAACASSLYAVKLACDRLRDGSADLMVAGGVARADDLFIQLGFRALQAMSRSGRSRPFHRDADGVVPGEGAAFVALMRLPDAVRAGVRITGLIRGVGLANDGRAAGLLAPSESGQVAAMRAAYADAGIDPATVGLLECHATGTPLGDATEVRSSSAVFAGSSGLVIGSVKANVGHLLAAAGGASLLKVLGALEHAVLPPTPGAADPPAALRGTPLRLAATPEDWPGPRRAAISAFGFGGNNAHLVVDAWTGDETPLLPAPAPSRPAPLAVVAVAARVGDSRDVHALARHLLAGTAPGRRAAEVAVDVGELCFPPLDLGAALPQQTLLFQTVRDAVRGTALPRDRTTVIVGMGCDPDAARPVARWAAAGASATAGPAERAALAAAFAAPPTAAGVLGSMANVVANRLSAQLDLTGPAYTVSSEEDSGLVALGLGAAALRAGEVDVAVAAAVDLSDEPVHRDALAALGSAAEPADGAVVVVLKRLADARADGDAVLAVLDGAGAAAAPDLVVGSGPATGPRFDPAEVFGSPHAAVGLLAFVTAVLCSRHRMLPRAGGPAAPALRAPVVDVAVTPMSGATSTVRLHPGDPAGLLAAGPATVRVYSGADRAGVAAAVAAGAPAPDGPARLVVTATGDQEHAERAAAALRWLDRGGPAPTGVVFRERPVTGEVAFVFAGGATAQAGMGRELLLAAPGVVEGLTPRVGPVQHLLGWAYGPCAGARHALDQIWGSVVLAAVQAEILRDVLGVRPAAALGYSSGEIAALVALGGWPDVRALTDGAADPDLFERELAASAQGVARAWERLGVRDGRWGCFLVEGPPELVRAAVADEPGVHVMIVNAPGSAVVGGVAAGCARALARCPALTAFPIPYDIPAHVPELSEVRERWRQRYRLPTRDAGDVRFYGCAGTRSYRPTVEAAATAVADQMLDPIDFAATVEQAWADGVRVFVELGPGRLAGSFVRRVLGGRDAVVVSADAGERAAPLAEVAAELVAAGVVADADALQRWWRRAVPADAGRVPARTLVLAAHRPPPALPERRRTDRVAELVVGVAASLGRVQQELVAARRRGHEQCAASRQDGVALLAAAPRPAASPAMAPATGSPVLDRRQLEEHACGSLAAALGPAFATPDTYRRRIRVPGVPFLLIDRITRVEPDGPGAGTIWARTEVRPDASWLHAGRIRAGVLAECTGQANLVLLSLLGLDHRVAGERVYRLLACEVVFHAPLPRPGDVLDHRVRLEEIGMPGGPPLFAFAIESRRGGELVVSITEGRAGMFTDEEREGARRPTAADVPAPERVAFDADQVRAFAQGRPADCFGPAWDRTRSHVRSPRIPDGDGRFVSVVERLDPDGGPAGRGFLRARMPVEPDAWFFAAHFVGDPCMPGTLVSEGCYQSMAFYLAAAGATVDRDGWRFEPVRGRFHFRSETTPDSREVVYELSVLDLVAGPVPTLVADVVCLVDGVESCRAQALTLRLVPDWPFEEWHALGAPARQTGGERLAPAVLAGLAGHRERGPVARVGDVALGRAAMLACAWGRPSAAYGAGYRDRDDHRHLARLPAPPFLFVDRVVALDGPPWAVVPGTWATAEYDVPDTVWYLDQNDQPVLPLAVLMEVALQSCGWLAGYMGSGLRDGPDLYFRNLDATATFHGDVGPGTRVLATTSRLLSSSDDGHNIIQAFEARCLADGVAVCTLTTTFGFFPRSAFEDMTGIATTAQDRAAVAAESSISVDLTTRPARYFDGRPRLPGPALLMIDRVTGFWPAGGRAGLGRLRAERAVSPDDWYFAAHFFQDPVQPGSLGVQAIAQLVQFFVIERGLAAGVPDARFAAVLPEQPVRWRYRGQVVPESRMLTVEVEIVSAGPGPDVVADGRLWVDGMRIYEVHGLGVTWRAGTQAEGRPG